MFKEIEVFAIASVPDYIDDNIITSYPTLFKKKILEMLFPAFFRVVILDNLIVNRDILKWDTESKK